MAIEAMCLGCGKRYQLADKLSGKRVKCKECGGAIDLPRIEAHEAHEDIAFLAPFDPGIPDSRIPDPQPTPSGNANIQSILSTLNRVRPRSLWTWAAAIIALLLLVGFLSVNVAVFTFFVLGGLGVLTLTIALVWSAMIGLVQGSKAIVGALATATTAALGLGALKLLRAISRGVEQASHAPSGAGGSSEQVPWTTVALGISMAFGLIAIVVGFVKNPMAFRRPFHVFLIGVVLVGVCWIPMNHWKGSSPSSPSRAVPGQPYARSQPPPPPTYPPGIQPPLGVPTGPRVNSRSERSRSGAMPMEPKSSSASARPAKRVHPAATAPTAPQSSPAAAADSLQVKWGGSWWDARVLRKEGEWTLVEYTADHTREWIEAWRMRKSGSTTDDLPVIAPNRFDTSGGAPSDPPRAKPAK